MCLHIMHIDVAILEREHRRTADGCEGRRWIHVNARLPLGHVIDALCQLRGRVDGSQVLERAK